MALSRPLRLLIVEDEVVDRKLLERLLAQSSGTSLDVHHADRLGQALEMVRDLAFDVVLLDLGLPDSQGIGSVTRLQGCAPDVPIIVLSGLDDENTETLAVQHGAQDYLIKGQVDANTLIRSIRYALERKKTERQLQAAELWYRTIFEDSAVAIMLMDAQDRLVSWNRFTERLLGLGEDDLRGRHARTFYPSSEWQRLSSLGTSPKAMQRHLETKMICGNGAVVDVDISLSIVRDSENKVTGSIAVVRDITERVRIHEILDRKQRNLEAIFDAAPVGMLLLDEALRVVRANDAIRRISGKGYPDIIGREACPALGCTRGEHLAENDENADSCDCCSLRRMIRAVLASGESFRGVEIRPAMGTDKGQAPPWMSASVEPVSIDGGRHVLAALHDITDRKRAEEELRGTMEMKSQFISTISHELRTPLTSMKEAVIIVLEGVAGKVNKDQRRFLDIAKRNIDRLSRLIDDVLDFQKLSAGKMKFTMAPSNIAVVAGEVYTTMRAHASKSGLDLVLDVETNLPVVMFDSDRMIQAIMNLVSNAIKFTPEGGQVRISVRRQGEHIAIAVRDTGYGIPKEDMAKVFDRFYRVYRPGKEIKGTGLGLAIVSRIVAGHSGRIEVESELNKGTTFTVFLPIAPARTSDHAPDPSDRSMEDVLATR